jgi:tetratricopeptide (TPR) repeat protein
MAPDAPDILSPAVTALLEAHRRERAAHGSATVPPMLDVSLVPEAASSSPLFAPAAYAAGFAAMTAGDYRDGLARFRVAAMHDPLIVDPASQSAAMRAAIDRLRAGRMADAVAPLEAVVAAHPTSPEAHRLLGTLDGALGRTPAALDHLHRAVNLAPTDERSRLALSQVLLRAGSADDAIRELRESVAALPESGECWFLLAQALEAAGHASDAAVALDTAASKALVAGRSALALQAAGIADLHQDLDRSLAWLRWRVRAAPNDAAVHRDFGIPLARRGRREEALAELVMADLLGDAGAEGLTVLGQTLLGADHLPEAETVLRRAVALDPDRQDTHYALGRTLLRQGRAAEARAQLDLFQQIRRRAMEQQRQAFEIDKLRAEAAREAASGHVGRLAAIWRDIADRRPEVVEFQVAAGDALAVLGDVQGAIAYFTRAVGLGGGPAVEQRLSALRAKTNGP